MRQTFTILYEDSDIIVCFKPHGLATQSRRAGTPDLERLILTHLAQSGKTSGKAVGRPYLAVIHRLDQPVAGILVFGKNKSAAAKLNKQMTGKGFGKYYLALTDGIPNLPEQTLTNYMVKDAASNTSRIADRDTPDAKKAILHYRTVHPSDVLSEDSVLHKDYTPSEGQALLEVHLDTGRHHQIRVQLSHMSCPIAGDTKYNPNASAGGRWETIRLCAYKLSFDHPRTGKKMEFHC